MRNAHIFRQFVLETATKILRHEHFFVNLYGRLRPKISKISVACSFCSQIMGATEAPTILRTGQVRPAVPSTQRWHKSGSRASPHVGDAQFVGEYLKRRNQSYLGLESHTPNRDWACKIRTQNRDLHKNPRLYFWATSTVILNEKSVN